LHKLIALSAILPERCQDSRIRRACQTAWAALLLTPELSLCGYPPEDLLLREGFYRACDVALNNLAHQVEGIAVVVGIRMSWTGSAITPLLC